MQILGHRDIIFTDIRIPHCLHHVRKCFITMQDSLIVLYVISVQYVHPEKSSFKLTQFGKVHFTKANELKLIQVELFLFFHFKRVATSVSEFSVWPI